MALTSSSLTETCLSLPPRLELKAWQQALWEVRRASCVGRVTGYEGDSMDHICDVGSLGNCLLTVLVPYTPRSISLGGVSSCFSSFLMSITCLDFNPQKKKKKTQ